MTHTLRVLMNEHAPNATHAPNMGMGMNTLIGFTQNVGYPIPTLRAKFHDIDVDNSQKYPRPKNVSLQVSDS